LSASPETAIAAPGESYAAAAILIPIIEQRSGQETPPPMLEVHAPHETVHTWKDFFIHIGTISVGLLITIALEQTVETLHRGHELAALREDLNNESRQILADCRRTETAQIYEQHWLNTRVTQVQAALSEVHPLGARESNDMPYYASPDIPIWRSAKAAARTSLLTKGEANAYPEVEYVQTHVDALQYAMNAAENAVRSFNREFPALLEGDPNMSKASAQSLHTYLTLLTTTYETVDSCIIWVRVLSGAELGIISGKTNLEEIYASERKAGYRDVRRYSM
jgi:hypothetical protein